MKLLYGGKPFRSYLRCTQFNSGEDAWSNKLSIRPSVWRKASGRFVSRASTCRSRPWPRLDLSDCRQITPQGLSSPEWRLPQRAAGHIRSFSAERRRSLAAVCHRCWRGGGSTRPTSGRASKPSSESESRRSGKDQSRKSGDRIRKHDARQSFSWRRFWYTAPSAIRASAAEISTL
jgi:hypothetical protein